jgi:hypothetical protein
MLGNVGSARCVFTLRGGRCRPARRGAALRFGDIAGAHFIGDIGAALLGRFMSARCGKVEPLVRLDQIAAHPMAAGRKGDAQIEERVHIPL